MKCLRCQIREVSPGYELCDFCQEELYAEEREREYDRLTSEQIRRDKEREDK